MKRNQILNALHRERHTNRDTDRAHGQKLDYSFDTHRPVWPNPLVRRQTDHLRFVEKKLTGTAFARIHRKLSDRLTEQLRDWAPAHVVRDIEGVNVHHFARIIHGAGGSRSRAFNLVLCGDHTLLEEYRRRVTKSKIS